MDISYQDKTIEVKSINTTLIQIPDDSNKRTAIVDFQIMTMDNQSINAFGTSEGSKGQSTKAIIDSAIEQAKSSIFSVVDINHTQQHSIQSNPPRNNSENKPKNTYEKTEKQIRFAYAVAKEKNVNLDDISSQICHKKFDTCTKYEASKIIDFLKQNGEQNNDDYNNVFW